MDNQVLVTYASKYGSTAEIAQRIGQVLSQAGLETDVLPVDDAIRGNCNRTLIVSSLATSLFSMAKWT